MTPDDSHQIEPTQPAKPAQSFWRSRVGISLIIALAIAAVLLGFEHRVHIFAGNGFLAILLLGCVVMHLFMHGGHGGHGGGDKS
ncbi:hypothetical protein DC366_16255 [Pelagivirga sediminicola]|uniref:DUF2933 domain-containing protein n=1 Tax=Pelagivirga sediminicola TaxID=2170575 RepID=A0A2T7G3G8_9RHOB|nr:DUF2933 domain-containing protein [Pelagivirga sediminicola]PVA08967.1 hypothetical protein DC366_16255 [Pelagivirga sediminicola]